MNCFYCITTHNCSRHKNMRYILYYIVPPILHYSSTNATFLVLDYVLRSEQTVTTFLLQTNQLQKISY